MDRKTLGELTPDPYNLRKHDGRNLDMLEESLRRFGANRPIVIDEDNTVLAGNGVLEAAKEVGIDGVRVIEVDGEEIVAVMVKHLTPEQKREYAIADNRTAELSTWDTGRLEQAVRNGLDITGYFYTDELARVVGTYIRTEEEEKKALEMMEKAKVINDRLQAEARVVTCPHCYHEWSLDDEGG